MEDYGKIKKSDVIWKFYIFSCNTRLEVRAKYTKKKIIIFPLRLIKTDFRGSLSTSKAFS